MKPTSLNATFTLSITLFAVCVIIGVTWFFYQQEKMVLVREVQRHGVSLAENLAYNSEYGLLFADVDGLQNLVDGVVQDKDVLYAVIFTDEGEIVAQNGLYRYFKLEHLTQKRLPEFVDSLRSEPAPAAATRLYATEDEANLYDIFAPVFFTPAVPDADQAANELQTAGPGEAGTAADPDRPEAERELVGVVVVGLSFDRVTILLRQIQAQVLKLALFIVVLAIIVARFLVNTISHPLKKLAAGTHRIAKGDLTREVEVNATNEIGDLAQSFNQMMHDLRTSREQLELWAQTLENRVQERTQEIQEKNAILTELIEEMQRIQEQLVHSEKMASLGQLVAGIAHEINNPVNFISSNITPLKQYIADIKQLISRYDRLECLNPTQRQTVDELKQTLDFDFLMADLDDLISDVETGARRIKHIVQDLRNFSRLDEAELKTIDLHESLDTTLNLLGHLYENRITVHKDYGAIPAVECYAGQLNQVFMNLLANAAQAFDRKGEVWITTAAANGHVQITIRDNGRGIAEDVLPKIFDPFFTTKDVGEGTGLGLSIAYGIIEKHQGDISVQSTVGRGTTFTITIPQKLSVLQGADGL